MAIGKLRRKKGKAGLKKDTKPMPAFEEEDLYPEYSEEESFFHEISKDHSRTGNIKDY